MLTYEGTHGKRAFAFASRVTHLPSFALIACIAFSHTPIDPVCVSATVCLVLLVTVGGTHDDRKLRACDRKRRMDWSSDGSRKRRQSWR